MKLIKALVVLLVMAGIAAPSMVIAEDRLSLSGEMRVRGWYDSSEWDDADFDQSKTFADQRLRIGGKIAVAEGVSITFRTDITEKQWGGGGSDFGAGRGGDTQQWDRAHIDLTQGDWHLRIGQQFFGTGTAWAFDSQEAGITLDYNGIENMAIRTFFLLDDQNSDGDLDGSDSDALEFGAKIFPKGDNWKAGVFVVGQSKRNDEDEEVFLIGVNGSTSLGPVNLTGEVDFFTGDASEDFAGDTVDAMGSQVFLDASMAATDALTIGAHFYYAAGDDEDVQYTRLGNGFNGWDPVFDNGTQLSNEEMDLGDNLVCDLIESCGPVFDFTGEGAGVVGGKLYASMMLGDTKLGASAAYLQSEEDDVVDSSGMFLSAGLVYPVMANTTFQLQLQYSDVDVDEVYGFDVDTDANSFQAGTGLFVKF